MAGFYNASINIVNRDGNGKAAAKIAYITRQEVKCLATGEVKHPSSKEDCLSSGIVFPDWLSEAARERWSDMAQLAYDTEQAEADGGQIMRNWIICFDKTLSDEQVESVTKEIACKLAEEGMWVVYAQHDGGDNENKHAHLLTPTRQFDENGHYKEHKTKQVFANDTRKEIDPKTGREVDRPFYNPDKPNDIESGNRIPRLDKDGYQKVDSHGKRQWVRVTIEANPWNNRDNVERWRAMIADVENRYLSPEQQVDHRSYERQGLEKKPTHFDMGVNAYKMHQKFLKDTEKDPGRIEQYAVLADKIQEINARPLLPEDKPAWMYTDQDKATYQVERERILAPLIREKEMLASSLKYELSYQPRMEYISRYDLPGGDAGNIEKVILDVIHTILYLVKVAIYQAREADVRRLENEIYKLKTEMYLASAVGASKGMDQAIMTANEVIMDEQRRFIAYSEKMIEAIDREKILRSEQPSIVCEHISHEGHGRGR